MYQDVIDLFPPKKSYNTYVEAFGGAASVLFQKEPSPIEIYNDLNKNVYSFFKVLSDKKMFKEFKDKCDLSPYSKTIRDECKEKLKLNNLSLIERAYCYFYVNRTSINGVGGFASTMIVRRNMSKSVSDFLSSIDGLFKVHQRISRVIIENRNAMELIEKYDRDNVFMYLDSPYHQSMRTETRYEIDMNDEQQINYIKLLLNIKKAKILVSGYDCHLYNKLCENKWERKDISVKTMDGNRKPKHKIESMWMNYDISKLLMNENTLWN